MFEAISEVKGPSETALFARSATAGGQRFPVHWGGDSESTYEAMAGVLRGGLSLAMCGFGFWSHDIGGFEVGVIGIALMSGNTPRGSLLQMGGVWAVLLAREVALETTLTSVTPSRFQLLPSALDLRRRRGQDHPRPDQVQDAPNALYLCPSG